VVVIGWLLAIYGETLAELDELDEALDQVKKGVELTEQGKDMAMIGWSNLCLMRVLWSKRDMTGAEEIIRKVERIAQKYYVPPWIMNPMSAWQARIWLAQKELEAATRWVGERGLDVEEDPTYLNEMEYIMLARIFITQGRFDESARLLERLIQATETAGRISRAIECLILQALLFQAKGDPDRAMNALERALALAEPGGFIRIFVDEGQPIAALLAKMRLDQSRLKGYRRRLLVAYRDEKSHPSSRSSQLSIESLSEREIEVLELIAKGLTNQEIASRLYLSLNTVKVHTRNIYGKLGTNNRTHAAAKARDLGILPTT
jgi:LuxR family maltose regulon positive regulatory protein